MTYSRDMGQTWKQQNIGDKYKIKNIFVSDGNFIGITNYSFIKSTDDGRTWKMTEISDEPNIINFTSVENNIYILTKNSILKSDYEFNIQSEPLVELEENAEYTDFKSDKENLYFIKDKINLQVYNIESKELSSIDVIDIMECSTCISISDVQTSDDMIYIKMTNRIPPDVLYPYLLKSSDNGATWINTGLILPSNTSFKVVDNKLHYITPRIANSSNRAFYSNGYYRLDSTDIVLDTNYITWLNTEEKISRRIRGAEYTDFTIFEDNIVAVGNGKLISVSNNAGKSFEFKSITNNTYSDEHQVNIISDSLIYFIYGYDYYKTTDGGITWLPQLYNEFSYTGWQIVPSYYYIDEGGNGFANYRQINPPSDSNAIVTYSGAQHFTKSNRPEFNLSLDEGTYISRRGIDLGDKFILVRKPAPYLKENRMYTFFQYDKSLNLLDTTNLYASNIVNLTKTDDNELYALCLVESGENKADENGNSEDYEYRYELLKSNDKGSNWFSINKTVPIEQILYQFPGRDYYQYGNVVMEKSLQFDNYILYPTRDKKIYIYDILKNEFNNISLPGSYASLTLDFPFFKFENKLMTISNYEKQLIYFADFNQNGNIEWDSLSADEFFEDWNQYDFNPIKDETTRDIILLAKMLSNNFGYMITGETTETDIWKANLVKITKDKPTNVEVENNAVEDQRAYLWNSMPYPIPGKSVIKSRIYWNGTYRLSDLQLNVFDINGTKMLNPNLNINANNSYSGVLSWECSGVPSGVYLIQVQLNGESINIPVIVSE
ncbi:MAG: hypothetical protein R2863_02210 [Candidatus Kapaibacterium sp.]